MPDRLYGSCLSCTQAVRLDKDGNLRQHSRSASFGSGMMTLICHGSGDQTAESQNLIWDADEHRWVHPTEEELNG